MKSNLKLRWKKVGISLLCYYFLLTVFAFCSCPDPALPYFDFKSIDVKLNPPISTGFSFIIHLSELEYIAKENQRKSFTAGFNNSVLADCYANGDWGAKYGLSTINIYADSTFDTSIHFGGPINTLFDVQYYYNNATKKYETIPLEDIGNYPFTLNPALDIIISSEAKPIDLNRPYHFNIELVKKNGDTLTSTVGPLVWKN